MKALRAGLAGLAGVAVVALVALQTPVSAAPTPTPTPTSTPTGTPVPTPAATGADPESPLRVTVTQLLPRAPTAHGAIEVLGTVTNVGPTTVTRITVRLRVGSVIQNRGDLHAADTDRPVTIPVTASRTPVRTDLPAGAALHFDLRTTTDELRLRRLGVYPLDIEARGNAGNSTGLATEPLGLAPTWLPFFPDNPNPIRVAVVLPVVDGPHQGVDATLRDDDLAARLAPTGRVGALVNAARAAAHGRCDAGAVGPNGAADPAATRCAPVPVTLAVDPDLLVTATTMSRPYQVQGADGPSRAGTGTAAAVGWLTSIRAAAASGNLLALPYADPDVTALSRTAGGRDDVALASVLGRSTVLDLLRTAPVEAVAWPPAGPVSQAAADALARTGARALVLDESAYPQPEFQPNTTPDARTVVTTSVSDLAGLVSNTDLSDLVTGPATGLLGPRLAEQRFLAETAIIASERPGRLRTLLIAPDRRSPVSLPALAESLRDLGRVPWLCPVSLTAVASGTESCPHHPVAKLDPTDRGQPRTDSAGQLSTAYLAGVAADRDVVAQLTSSVLSDKPDPTIRRFVADTKSRLRQAVARAESSAWRGRPKRAAALAAELHQEVQQLEGKVVLRGGRALLTSSKGTLQVSVENTLDVPVRIRIRFTSKTATLSAAETGVVEVPPGHAVQAGVKAQAQRSGQFVVFAQILDRNGKPFGAETEVIVRSTQFGRLALAVTAGGLGVLLAAAGFRIVRRALRARS